MGEVSAAFELRDPNAKGMMAKYLTAYDYSILNGELINPNAPMTREQAISKLTEAKSLLDLDMMSKEEYDAIKLEVTPIIKNK